MKNFFISVTTENERVKLAFRIRQGFESTHKAKAVIAALQDTCNHILEKRFGKGYKLDVMSTSDTRECEVGWLPLAFPEPNHQVEFEECPRPAEETERLATSLSAIPGPPRQPAKPKRTIYGRRRAIEIDATWREDNSKTSIVVPERDAEKELIKIREAADSKEWDKDGVSVKIRAV